MTGTTQELLTAHFTPRPGVAGRKAFSRDALTINGKIFAIFRFDTVVLKLPVETGRPLLESGAATQFEPGPGRFMREWFVLGPETNGDRLLALAEQAFDFVLSLQNGTS